VVDNDQALLLVGIDLQARWQSSFWDALILAAAQRSRVGVIWSEEFNTAQDYDGVVA
jgi:predicted nucleic acid-binding protein